MLINVIAMCIVLLFNAGLQCEFNWTFSQIGLQILFQYQCIIVASALDYSSWFGPISNQSAGTIAAAAVQSNVHHKIGRSRVRCR